MLFNIRRLSKNCLNLSKNMRKKVTKKGVFISQLQWGAFPVMPAQEAVSQ